MANHPPLISSAELAARKFPPVRWPILDLLPEGLAVLAGPRGAGKSSLALNLAVAVSRGTPLFDAFPVEQGHCLVVTLEESERRLQDRLSAVLSSSGASPSEDLHLYTWLPDGEEESLKLLIAWIEEHPGAKLVVIDPLRRMAGRENGPYALLSQAEHLLDSLSAVARKYSLAILCTHHARIPSASDTVNPLPQRLRFAEHADTFLLLERGKNRSRRILYATGRDFPERRLLLVEGSEFGQWREAEPSSSRQERRKRRKESILRLLEKESSLTPRKIAEGLEENRNTVRSTLTRMLAKGLLIRTGNGKYALPEEKP